MAEDSAGGPHNNSNSNTDPTTNEPWKSQPPYLTTADQPAAKQWTAHCHCGRVQYFLSRAQPLACKFCHCADCRTLHGAPFQWAAIYEKRDVHFERGVDGLAFYHSPARSATHRLPCKVSCAYCGSPLMDEGRNVVLVFPGAIEFPDAERRKMFDPHQRVVDIHDGKPKWSKLDGQSELMKEVEGSDPKEHNVLGGAKKGNMDD
ncbi:hypothetical protein AAE478_004456 [Parahypoxylon ruwenzoriense]